MAMGAPTEVVVVSSGGDGCNNNFQMCAVPSQLPDIKKEEDLFGCVLMISKDVTGFV
jgi:hypothetical protein